MPATETDKAAAQPATEKAPSEAVKPSDTGGATDVGKAEIAEEVTYPTLLYTVVTRDAEAAIKYYESALGGSTKYLFRDNSGKIMHSVIETSYGMCISINDYYPNESLVEPAEEGGTKSAKGAFNYVTIPKGKGTADDAVERMREAGGEVVQEAKDFFYGHRCGKVVDKYGVGWVFAHEIEKKDK